MTVCWCICGSFCTLSRVISQMEAFARGGDTLIPVVSETVATLDTRFGKSADFLRRVEEICRRPPVTDIVGAEPIGPKLRPDLAVIAPCTCNTLSKLAHGISDSAVTLAAKSHLRRGAPLLISLSGNDVLAANFKNLAALYTRKNIFFVPMRQDDPVAKPFSCVADETRLPEAISAALEGRQLKIFN